MALYEWFIFFLIIQVIHFLGTWKLYQIAGRKAWEAGIPIYNAIILMKIINRPWWYVILLFVPIINLLMFPVIWVETLRSFGKNSTLDTLLGVGTLGFYIYFVNYTQKVEHIKDRSLKPKNATADFISSIIFAVIVATIVHTYVMQPYNIPTSSLEKSLLVGDFLFVSKFHYGARTPSTAVAFPMVHDTMPFFGRSYAKWPQLPSLRFPAIEKIEKNDIVVFNWPTDTVYFFRDASGRHVDKPLDKRSNYVKRCLATPGDSLKIVNGDVFINGQLLPLHDRQKLQYSYNVTADVRGLSDDYLRKELQITDGFGFDGVDKLRFAALTDETAARLKANPAIKSIEKSNDTLGSLAIFPHSKPNWSVDNMGPLYIPKQGVTVELNKETLPFYERIIKEYEHNQLTVSGDDIRINGVVTNQYTFQQDYYWMMGDNRHNSEDSRYWGYVPADHVVGKPVFIWMSLDQNIPWSKAIDKIRWNRLFTTVGGSGKPVSYFKYFVILVLGWYGWNFYRKRKKKA